MGLNKGFVQAGKNKMLILRKQNKMVEISSLGL